MSLEYAILGFLNYHSFTGYDLKKAFDSSVRHRYWCMREHSNVDDHKAITYAGKNW